MKALTIRQPWAWAIGDGFKPVENRTRRTNHRGTVLIHAGLAYDYSANIARHSRDAAIRLDQLGGASNFWEAAAYIPSRLLPAPHPTLALGAVIAVAELTDCHRADGCCTPWGFSDAWHWQLADVQALPEPVPARGQLGLWTPPDDVLAAVQRQITEVTL